MHRLQELVRLYRLGVKSREVARLLRMSPNTEREYRTALVQAALLEGDAADLPPLERLVAAVQAHKGPPATPEQSVSTVEPWRELVSTMLERRATPQAIYDALRLEHGYEGSLSAVKRFCLRLAKGRGPRPEDVAIPVDTAAGEIAQVDFGYVGKLLDPVSGAEKKAWVFVMVLAYSRHMFAEIVFDQKATTWVELHVRAFQYFGGVPRVVVPDNLKAAVVRAAFGAGDDLALNRTYRELARHYQFRIDPTPPYAPQKKGKVESGVKYVKRNFFLPRGSMDVLVARQQLARWLDEIAGERRHGTTHVAPRELFETAERDVMLPLPTQPYELIEWRNVTVHADCHAFFDGRLYSAPWPLIGQKLWVRATPHTVDLYRDDDTERVAWHERRGVGPRSTIETHLPEHRRDYRFRRRSYWEERAALMGEEVAAYIRAVFDSDDVLYQLRAVQSMVKHLETFPRERAQRACKRALYYASFKYGALKKILRDGLDFERLDGEAAPSTPPLSSPRFARTASELVNPNLELFTSSKGDKSEYH